MKQPRHAPRMVQSEKTPDHFFFVELEFETYAQAEQQKKSSCFWFGEVIPNSDADDVSQKPNNKCWLYAKLICVGCLRHKEGGRK